MYAVIKVAGQQFKVSQGDVIDVEVATPGEDGVAIDQVLLVGTDEGVTIGKPTLDNVVVKTKVVETFRDKKITIIKHRRRQNSMNRMGHRQNKTRLSIESIDIS